MVGSLSAAEPAGSGPGRRGAAKASRDLADPGPAARGAGEGPAAATLRRSPAPAGPHRRLERPAAGAAVAGRSTDPAAGTAAGLRGQHGRQLL